ncbi:MAG: PIN domain-containing protein [Lacipirellulaceae bacterium]
MPQRILIDTGPIVAILDSKDQHHNQCAHTASNLPDIVLTCWPVITEACYLLRSRPDLVDRFLEMIHDGVYEVLDIDVGEITEVGGVLAKYRDQQIDLADACLAHLAARESIDTVFTVDQRHFSLFRNVAGDALQLIPDLR